MKYNAVLKSYFFRERCAETETIWDQRLVVDLERIKLRTCIKSPLLRGLLYGLQTATKLQESLEMNILQHPIYLVYHPETSKLETKGTKHEA